MLERKQRIKAFLLTFIISTMSISEGNIICNLFTKNESIAYADSNYGTYTVGNATYTYEVTDSGTIYIEEYKGTDSKVVIPEQMNGKTVTAIGVYAFGECKTVEEVVIPDTVTEICSRAFIDCTNLKKVKLSENTEYIGALAFTYCSSLESIVIPDSVTEIWDYAFYECTNIKNIQLSKKITYIGEAAFGKCESLESIELPESLTEISASLFANCVGLESIVIPNSVTKIEQYAFFWCTKLNDIKLSERLKSIGDYTFRNCCSLEKVKIPQSVESIGKEAFNEDSVYILYNNSYVKNYANQNNIATISPSENAKIERKINSVLSGISDEMSDVEKVLFIHDWLVRECDYDYYNYLNDTIPKISFGTNGVYLYETAVCNGYAKTMDELLDLVGIESRIVSSDTMVHAWNLVKIDGNWYHLDATWDDPVFGDNKYADYNREGYVSHKYFLKSDSEFKELGHYAWSEDAPKCTTENSFSDCLFREDAYNSALNYYNGYWYFQKDGVLWKSTISGQKEKVRNTNGYYNDLNAFIYNDYIYPELFMKA